MHAIAWRAVAPACGLPALWAAFYDCGARAERGRYSRAPGGPPPRSRRWPEPVRPQRVGGRGPGAGTAGVRVAFAPRRQPYFSDQV